MGKAGSEFGDHGGVQSVVVVRDLSWLRRVTRDIAGSLAGRVCPPTPDVAVSHHTRVAITGSDFGDLVRPVNPGSHRPHDVGRGIGGRLAVRVCPPTPDVIFRSSSHISHRTRVFLASSDFGDHGPIQIHDLLWRGVVRPVGSGRAVRVPAPAPDVAVCHRTRVFSAGSDFGDHGGVQCLEFFWHQHNVAALGTVSDLAGPVRAPAPDVAVCQRTKVFMTGRNRGGADPNCGYRHLIPHRDILHLDRLSDPGLYGTDRQSAIAGTLPVHGRLDRSPFLVAQVNFGDRRGLGHFGRTDRVGLNHLPVGRNAFCKRALVDVRNQAHVEDRRRHPEHPLAGPWLDKGRRLRRKPFVEHLPGLVVSSLSALDPVVGDLGTLRCRPLQRHPTHPSRRLHAGRFIRQVRP